MEPFGAAVSALTVLEVISKSIRYLQAVKNAPAERRTLLEEVRRMRDSLDSLQLFIVEKDEESTWRKDLEELERREGTLERCAKAMQKLNDKLYPIEKHGVGKLWQALTWKLSKEDVKDLLGAISRTEAGVDRMLQKANTDQILHIRNDVEKLTTYHSSQELVALLDWLCPTTYDMLLQDKLPAEPTAAGRWFLSDQAFLDWTQASHGAVLLCPGHQGSGKTVIASLVVRHLQEHLPADNAILFLYFDHKRQQEQTIAHVISSMIRQLTIKEQIASPELTKCYKTHQRSMTRPGIDELRKLLRMMLQKSKTVHFVVDALDEASEHSPDVQRQLTDLLGELRQCHRINLFVTCRDLPHIQEKFAGDCKTVRISANPDDLRHYLTSRTADFSLSVQKKPEAIAEALHKVIEATEGMFLLARLLMDSLTQTAETPRHLQELLRNMSASTYESAYGSAMNRITTQTQRRQSCALRTLKWIVRAKELLSPSALQRALAIHEGDEKLDEDGIPEMVDILAACQGMVIVDDQSDVIRLVHKTAHEFLQTNHLAWLPDADYLLCQTCLTCCGFDSASFELDQQNTIGRATSIYAYAVEYSGRHAYDLEQSSDAPTAKRIMGLVSSTFARGRAKLLWQALQIGRQPRFPGRAPTAWDYFARWNLHHSFALAAADTQQRQDTLTEQGNSALQYAAEFGAKEVAQMILDTRLCEINASSPSGSPPFCVAAKFGNCDILMMLLNSNGLERDSRNIHGLTALALAARNSDEAAVTLLIDAGCDPNIRDTDGATPLLHSEQQVLAQALLESGAFITAKDHRGQTALHMAVKPYETSRHHRIYFGKWPSPNLSASRAALVTSLLEYGADVHARDENGQSPLHHAVGNGFLEAAISMIQHGAIATLKDDQLDTPLWLAANSMFFWRRNIGAESLCSAFRDHSSTFDQDIRDCYERCVSRAKESLRQLTQDSDRNASLTTCDDLKYLRYDVVASNDPSSVFITSIQACLGIENHAADEIVAPRPIRGIFAQEWHVSIIYSQGRVRCELCSTEIEDDGLHCYECSDGDFDICAKCLSPGNWCYDQGHRLQKFLSNEVRVGDSAPWHEFKQSAP